MRAPIYSPSGDSTRHNANSLTDRSTTNWRQWWADESERVGTNWQSLIELHFAICNRLQASSSWWRR
jgi:hypothetical protein